MSVYTKDDSSNSTTVVTSSGVGVCGLLGVAFVVLRLCGVITWPWVWVLAPLWIPVAAIIALLVITFIIGLIIGVVGYFVDKSKGK